MLIKMNLLPVMVNTKSPIVFESLSLSLSSCCEIEIGFHFELIKEEENGGFSREIVAFGVEN